MCPEEMVKLSGLVELPVLELTSTDCTRNAINNNMILLVHVHLNLWVHGQFVLAVILYHFDIE